MEEKEARKNENGIKTFLLFSLIAGFNIIISTHLTSSIYPSTESSEKGEISKPG